MKLVRPPSDYIETVNPSVFLAGSIEMGLADNWQDRVAKALEGHAVTLYNPRRPDWDSSWVQSVTNEQFVAQVNWELTRLESCTLIPMYFDPNTKSPISLLELGLFSKTYKMIVCCPEGSPSITPLLKNARP